MKNLILLLILLPISLFSQAYREVYTTKLIINENTDNNNNLFIVQAPALAQSVTFTIPVGEGQNGDILTTNGINSTTWSEIDFGSVGGNGNGLIQFNESGFGASNSFIWDNVNGFLGVGLESPSYSLHTSGTISIGSVGNPAVLALGSANSGGNYLYIKSNAASNSSVNFTLPADNGSPNQGLITNSSGSLSWGGEIKKGPVSNNEPDNNDINNNPDNAYIGGGADNDINNNADNSTIYGGDDNDINNNANSAIIYGGDDNDINNNSDYSVILGGSDNDINNNINSAIMVGGSNNDLNNTANYSFIGAGEDNDFNNTANSSVIFAGRNNDLNNNSSYVIIGAGNDNDLQGNYSGIFSGSQNDNNSNSTERSIIFAGYQNSNNDNDSFIGAGTGNSTNNEHSVILGGYNNDMTNNTNHSAILWGRDAGFSGNGNYTFVGGRDASISNNSVDCIMFGRKPNNWGSRGNFLFGDSHDGNISTGGSDNQFRARFSGGYRLWSNADGDVGVGMDAGDNAWFSVSDRNLKESIIALNPLEFLNKIKKLDIFSWSYKGFEDKGIRNYGPMAQDFYALFGEDEHGIYGNNISIKELDAASIFILGVQGSTKELEIQNKRIDKLDENNEFIDSKLKELENKLKKYDSK